MRGLLSVISEILLVFLAVFYLLSSAFMFNVPPLSNAVAGADFSCYYFRAVSLKERVDIYDVDAVRAMASLMGYPTTFPE